MALKFSLMNRTKMVLAAAVNTLVKSIMLAVIFPVGSKVHSVLQSLASKNILQTNLFAGLLPKSALTVEEEAWNAYPYTKTRYTCPFVEKFSLEIETYYFPDDGHQENVFKLSGNDLRNRAVGKTIIFDWKKLIFF